jgi:small-conductance mechanosensitive channel
MRLRAVKQLTWGVKKIRRQPRWIVHLAATSLWIAGLLPATDLFAAEEKSAAAAPAAGTSAAPQAAAPTPPNEIPLADIAAKATEVSNFLGSLSTAPAASAQIENIAKSLPELSSNLDAQSAATKTTLEGEATLETLQTLQQQWQRHQTDATAWLTTLTQHATRLQAGLNQLTELQKTWSSTRSSAEAAKAPGPIVEQIDTTLKAIADTQTKLQAERAALLDLQSRVALEVNKCGAALTQIAQYQQKAVAGIFVPDAPPLWRVELWADAFKALPDHVARVRNARWAEFTNYLRETRDGSGLHGALFIVVALLFCAARRRIAAWERDGVAKSEVLSVFDRPYSAALTTALLFATSPFFQLANPVRQVLTLIALVPMVRLVQATAGARVVAAFHVAVVLFAVETLRQAYGSIQVIGQAMLVVETFAAIFALFALRRYYRQLLAQRSESSHVVLLKAARVLVIGGLIFSLLAGVAGYVRLSRLLTPAILVGGILALAVYAYLRVLGGVLALGLRLWPLRLLRMVQNHRESLERQIYRVLVWMAVLAWIVRYLGYLGLLDSAWSSVQAVLATKLERGTLSISVGNVIEFFAAIFAAYLLSRFLRYVLQEDVYPRIELAPGLSYAVSSLLNYIVLALGFVAGLGVLGVDFSKVSVLAGAFGVGIGFGLQSIVNNFVSGLILLFERPIHVGVTVDVGNLQGTVHRIGIRASVIHTGAGADIIVPNSQLVTDRVTNWTLSDRLRRVDLTVGVNYGADPRKVIELLEQVARTHPDVLANPAPRALFISYGDSSINFELRVWPRLFNLAAQVKSDLASAVYDAIHGAGMSFPFPQREVRILSDHAAELTAVQSVAGFKKP